MGKMGYGPHSFRAGFERRGLGSGHRTNRPQKGFLAGVDGAWPEGRRSAKKLDKICTSPCEALKGTRLGKALDGVG